MLWLILFVIIVIIWFLYRKYYSINTIYPISLNSILNSNNSSNAHGTASIKILGPNTIEYTIMCKNIQPNSVAHVMIGESDDIKDAVYLHTNKTQSKDTVYSGYQINNRIDTKLLKNLINGNCLLLISNCKYPNGEIRGHIRRGNTGQSI